VTKDNDVSSQTHEKGIMTYISTSWFKGTSVNSNSELCQKWSFHGSLYSSYGLLGCYAM